MSQQIKTIIAPPTVAEITKEEIATLEKAGKIPNGTPAAQVALFARVCADLDLSPFASEIYLVRYRGETETYSTICGINGFRKIAALSGQYAGCDDTKYDLQSDGTFKTASELQAAGKLPKTATVTVYRAISGQRCPFTHTAVFSEFSSGKQKWQTMPFQMIGKVAEAFALRKGFSDRVRGIFAEEELATINGEVAMTNPTGQPIERALPTVNVGKTANDWLETAKSDLANVEDFNKKMVEIGMEQTLADRGASVEVQKENREIANTKFKALQVFAVQSGIAWDSTAKKFFAKNTPTAAPQADPSTVQDDSAQKMRDEWQAVEAGDFARAIANITDVDVLGSIYNALSSEQQKNPQYRADIIARREKIQKAAQ